MPKILGIIGSILGAFVAVVILVLWQGDLSEIRNFFDAVWSAVVMSTTVGIIASLLVLFFHNGDKKLNWLKASLLSLVGLTWALGICITPSIIMYNNMTGISWPPPRDLIMLLVFFALACGTGHYVLFRIGYKRANKV